MTTQNAWVYVDDADTRIQYSDNWGVSSIQYAYDSTLHAASVKGATAAFTFTGIGVSVTGGQGDVQQYGWPSSSYAIDGKVYETYNVVDAHLSDPSAFSYQTTYFTTQDLSAGQHTLVITNLNGTSPNTYWIDYIAFLPPGSSTSGNLGPGGGLSSSQQSSSSTSPTRTQQSSQTSVSESTSANTSSSGFTSATSSSAGSTSQSSSTQRSSATTSPSSQAGGATLGATSGAPSAPGAQNTGIVAADTSSHSQNVGAIIGGAVGGAVVLALLAILGVYLYLRRRIRARQGGNLFDKMRYDPPFGPQPNVFPKAATFLPNSATMPSAEWPGQPPNSATGLLYPQQGAPSSASVRSDPDIVRLPSMRKDRNLYTTARAPVGTSSGPVGPSGPYASESYEAPVQGGLAPLSPNRAPVGGSVMAAIPPPYSTA
ncbi:hypothetical protein C8Q70DRAFT_182730 [Cubamyces menziesii]|nr:hypothetical protein C8Q70DRAFT_182730 [Cubamyces menziesii]